MTKSLFVLALAAALASTAVRAQDKPTAPAAAKPAPTPTVPLKVQIVISRYQGEKKISSMPYTLSVNAGANGTNRASIRMGAQVPVMMMAAPVVDGQKMPAGGPIQYKDIGTNIDCDAQAIEDGRFRIQVNVDDSSVYPDDQKRDPATSGSPSFRSFRATDSMMLRDGATSQFTAAVDKVSGETVKIDVTLTVVK